MKKAADTSYAGMCCGRPDNFACGGVLFGAYMGQKCQFWDTLGHGWDTITHMNFAELRMILFFNVLNTLEKVNALGRSLVIFKIALSRS
ncbi:hypothetical protein FGU55_01755 [Escherichia coli]|nr:hypothetical protein [Escherichia coli]